MLFATSAWGLPDAGATPSPVSNAGIASGWMPLALGLGATAILSLGLALGIRLLGRRRRAALERSLAGRTNALAAQRALSQLLLERSRDAFLAWDLAGRIIGVSPSAERLFGWSREELMRRNIRALLDPRHNSACDVRVAGLCSGRSPSLPERPVVLNGRRRDGSGFVFEMVPSASWLAGRTVVTAMLRDVTERVRLEAASRRSESLRVLLEQLPDAVMVHRGQRLLYVNQRFLERLGFDGADAVVGRSIREFVHPDDWRHVESRLAQLEATGKPVDRAEERFRGREDREVRWEVVKVPIVFDGRPAVVALGRDTSARHQAEALLHIADRLATVGTLAAGVAHGINNPLAYVKSNIVFAGSEIDELDRGQPEADRGARLAEIRRALDQATEGANRIRDIVADLITFSRSEGDAEAGRGVDLHGVLDSVAQLTAHALQPRARLEKRYGAVPPVRSESSRLAQAIANILLNVVQALPEGFPDVHSVTVSTWTDPESGFAVVEIRDDGEGMEDRVLARVFEPFFTPRPVGRGTGLGLSVAHGIVKAAGGRIEIATERGGGTRVRVALPPFDGPTAP